MPVHELVEAHVGDILEAEALVEALGRVLLLNV
jgi:hypothetical protein